MNLNYSQITEETIDQTFSGFDEFNEGLSEVNYFVDLNMQGVFSIRYQLCYTAAKKDCYGYYVNLDLFERRNISLSDLISEDEMENFYELLTDNYSERLRELDTHVKKEDEEVHEFLQTYIFDYNESLRFSISNKGLSFFYLFEFPSFAELYQPGDRVDLTWDELSKYLREDSDIVSRLVGQPS